MQKFQRGDLVKIVDKLPEYMSHFISGADAIVMYSYADKYGGTDAPEYCLLIKNKGQCSWYDEENLILIEKGRTDLIDVWKAEIEARIAEQSDLDWIFEHSEELLNKSFPGASIAALGKCLGMDNLWGEQGEGYIWYQNAIRIGELVKPFLVEKDKEGWLRYCKRIREDKR